MESKEINRPPKHLTIQLFIFMLLVVLKIMSIPIHIDYWMDDVLINYDVSILVIAYITDIVAYTYAFTAIYKTLQGKPYAILMLKFSVFYMIIHLLAKFQDSLGAVIQFIPFVFLPFLILEIVFFVYLFRSKLLEAFIPKKQRVFGIYGIFALLFYAGAIFTYGYPIGKEIALRINSIPINVNHYKTKDYKYIDGIASFKPLAEWEQDTVMGNGKDGYFFVFKTDSSPQIMISSYIEKCQTRIDHLQSVYEARNAFFSDSVTIIPIGYEDKIIDKGNLFSNTYQLSDKEGNQYYWTISSIVAANSYKVTCISILEKGSYTKSKQYTNDFASTVNFCLEE